MKQSDATTARYARASALVGAILNKLHNGSARAVDPFVIRALQEHEPRLLGIQCFLEEGPAENNRRLKDELHVAKHTHLGGVTGLFTVCGGFVGPGAVMRHWEAWSEAEGDEADREVAMAAYVSIVDKLLPGWDEATPDHPVASADRFWQDDAAATHCPLCLLGFSLRERRHHCRLCLAVFCSACCKHVVQLALCPGAPLRAQRVCTPCFQSTERAQQLREACRLRRENRELEQRIQAVLATAKQALTAKQLQEQELRARALAAGCDLAALDASIQRQFEGSSVGSAAISMELPTPPAAHRFASTQTSVEAADQLAFAHRQLLMSFKVAQCRAHRVLDRIDATLAALREAVGTARPKAAAVLSPSPGKADDNDRRVLLRHTGSFLTPDDGEALEIVANALHKRWGRKLPLLELDFASQWQAECLKDRRTRAYIADLVEAVRARLEASSGSDTEDSDPNDPPNQAAHPLWNGARLTVNPSDPTPAPSTKELESAYSLIFAQCETAPATEWDEQIRLDVARTFGVSARRQHPKRSSRSVCDSDGAPIPVETRRAALQHVLRACASVDTEVGYCQGLDHVAALILAVSDWQEPRAFWLLVSLLASPRFELERLYGPGLPHLSLRCFQLDRLLRLRSPSLSKHFEAIDFPISIVATGWFMTLFSNMEALSFDVLVRVFDRFLLKGWKLLFRVSLAILEELQGPILASSFDEIPRLFYDIQEYAPRLLTPEYVLTQAAKHKVTNRLLKRLQSEFEQQTATSSTSSKRLSVRTTQAPVPTNQRSLKSVATSPASSPGPETPPRPKTSSATREASPSRVHPSAAVQWTPDRSPAATKG